MLPEALTRRMHPAELTRLLEGAGKLPASPCGTSLEMAIVGTDSQGAFGHSQTWTNGTLISWVDGVSPNVDVIVSDDGTVRVGEWVGEPLGAGDGIQKDLEGWELSTIPVTVLTVTFGRASSQAFRLGWDAPFLRLERPGPERPVLQVSMSYLSALDWLWADVLLGNLLWRNDLPLAGNFFVLSAIEGIVSAPSVDPAPRERVDMLRRLASLFEHGALDGLATITRGSGTTSRTP